MSVPKNSGLLEEEEDGVEESYGTADSMDPELYIAATQGDILEFVIAMERGPEYRHFGPSGGCVQFGPQKNTVLHIATIFKHYEIVKLICADLPFFVAEKNGKGNTALHIAARAGDSLLVGLLVNSDWKEGVLGETNEEGNTALHEALSYHHEDVAWILIDKNRNMCYSVNMERKSVLYLAAEAGFAAIVKVLLENPMGHCSVGGRLRKKSPVHAAILGRNLVNGSGSFDVEPHCGTHNTRTLLACSRLDAGYNIVLTRDVLKILWEKDQSSFQSRCDEGGNPLHFASSTDYLEGVNFLLKKYSSFAYQRNKHSFFPIHIASSKGHFTIIQEILRHCPDSRELLTSQDENIIHVAAKNGKAKAIFCMLKMAELDKLVNERDRGGNTPLHMATIYGNPKIVSTLLRDEKVDIKMENNGGYTALDIAEEYMETTASFEKRLTWMALRVVGAPRSPLCAKVFKNKKAIFGDHSKMENLRDKINVILLVATLVATVTFTAGFTIPGGYNNSNPDQGLATMLAKVKFQEFVICDTIAMYSSIIVAVTLIWAQMSDFSSMHVALKLALPLLGIALAMMSVAFMAGVYVVVSKLSWLANVVLFMGSNFIIALGVFFVPLCFLGSSNYYMFRWMAYYPFRLVLYAFESYVDEDVEK